MHMSAYTWMWRIQTFAQTLGFEAPSGSQRTTFAQTLGFQAFACCHVETHNTYEKKRVRYKCTSYGMLHSDSDDFKAHSIKDYLISCS